jgi:hypothetical protein
VCKSTLYRFNVACFHWAWRRPIWVSALHLGILYLFLPILPAVIAACLPNLAADGAPTSSFARVTMVAQNPLFRGKWTLKKLQSTVINDIWPEMIFFTGVSVSKWICFSVLNTLCADKRGTF